MEDFKGFLLEKLGESYCYLVVEDYQNLYRGSVTSQKGKKLYFATEKFAPYGLEDLAKRVAERIKFNESNS